MSLEMQTDIDQVNHLISQNNFAEAIKVLKGIPFTFPLPEAIVKLWEWGTLQTIKENQYDDLLSLVSRSVADPSLKKAVSNAINNPEVEGLLLNNLSDEQIKGLIYYITLNSSLTDKWPNRWLKNDQHDLYINYLYSFGYQVPKTQYVNQAIEQGSLNILGRIISWDIYAAAGIDDDKMQELIKKAFDNNKFVFLFTMMRNRAYSHLITDEFRRKMREKFENVDSQNVDLALGFAPENFPIKGSLILKLIKTNDWANLDSVLKGSVFVDMSDFSSLQDKELADIRQKLLTYFGSSCATFLSKLERHACGVDYFIPKVDGLIYNKRIKTHHWLDLLPVDAYFSLQNPQSTTILNANELEQFATHNALLQITNAARLPIDNNTKTLHESIKNYHLIPKDSKDNILTRFEALYRIQQIADNLLNNNSYTKEQRIYLQDIAINCQNKSKYLMQLREMPHKILARLLRSEHREGQPLRVDNPTFPSTAASETPQTAYNSEVLADLDPYHRDIPYEIFEKWLKEVTSGSGTANLWLWLENHPEFNLGYNSHYLVPAETFKVAFDKQTGVVVGTSRNNQKSTVIDGTFKFNIGRDGQLYVDAHNIVTNHSHLAKEALLCAGMITFKNGKIVAINNGSGHYFPNRRHLLAGLRFLDLPLEAFSPTAKVNCYDVDRKGYVELGSVSELLHKAPVQSHKRVADAASVTSNKKRQSLLHQQTLQDGGSQTAKPKTTEFIKPASFDEFGLYLDKIANNDPSMHHVSFAYCGFAGWAQGRLIEGLPNNTRLISLDLTGAALITETFPQLLDALDQNKGLQYLNLSDTALNEEQLKEVKNLCEKKNITLEVAPSTVAKPNM